MKDADLAAHFLMLLGGLFFISLLVSPLARVLRVPRVTLLILSGVALGPVGANIFEQMNATWFALIADITLLIIGYLLGTRMTRAYLKQYAKGVLLASIVITLCTTAVVTAGLVLLGLDLKAAAILGAIAAATDPVAMVDVLRQKQASNAKGETPFTKLLEGIVAMDDILGLVVFSLVLATLRFVDSESGFIAPLEHMLYDIGGACLLGALAGFISARLLNGKQASQPVIVESLAFILMLGGVTIYFEVSYLLAAMVMGVVVVNLADETADHLHEMAYIEQPFLVLFFIMAGASLDLSASQALVYFIFAFVLLRVLGRYLGGLFSSKSVVTKPQRQCIGLALLPQAGVAMGMALVACNTYPELADLVLPVAISATVIFEVVGPVVTAKVLDWEAHQQA